MYGLGREHLIRGIAFQGCTLPYLPDPPLLPTSVAFHSWQHLGATRALYDECGSKQKCGGYQQKKEVYDEKNSNGSDINVRD